MSASMFVNIDAVNVRTDPSINPHNITFVAKRNTVFKVEPTTKTANGFVHVGNDKGEGWAFWDYLTVVGVAPREDRKVQVTTTLHVRIGPGTNYAALTSADLHVNDIVGVNDAGSTSEWWRLATADPRYIYRAYTVADGTPPINPPPSGQFVLPFGNIRGLHGNAGGWRVNTQELAIYQRNQIKLVGIPAYEDGQGDAIGDYKRAGVEHFWFRACLGGDQYPVAAEFAARTLPALKTYARALGTSKDMIIFIGNENNLDTEGWLKRWQDGTQFADWWLSVRAIYQRELPGCRLGWPATSPGYVNARRMDEVLFTHQAYRAVYVADVAGVHCYWANQDMSDFNPLHTQWKQLYGSLPLIGTEVGPVQNARPTNDTVLRAYAQMGMPTSIWLASTAGGPFDNAAWTNNPINLP